MAFDYVVCIDEAICDRLVYHVDLVYEYIWRSQEHTMLQYLELRR